MGTAMLSVAASTSSAGSWSTRTQRILVIGNDGVLQKTLQEIFSSQGYEVEAAFDEDQVLEMFRLEPFSAVILDLPQPIDSTFELCKEIVRLAPGSPLLILSASSHVVDKVLLLEMGADDYVTVPFSPRELVARLRALMRRAVRR